MLEGRGGIEVVQLHAGVLNLELPPSINWASKRWGAWFRFRAVCGTGDAFSWLAFQGRRPRSSRHVSYTGGEDNGGGWRFHVFGVIAKGVGESER